MDNTTNTERDDATQASDAGKTPAPSQTTEKPERTEADKAAFSLKKNAEKARELGLDPAEVLGIRPKPIQVSDDLADDAPMTVGTFRKLAKQDARKTAEQMVDSIADEAERARIKSELAFIVPSGSAEADFRRAQAAANAEHNALVATEVERRGRTRKTAAGGSADIQSEADFTPTAEEERMMRPPYNLSKDKVIAARERSAEKGK